MNNIESKIEEVKEKLNKLSKKKKLIELLRGISFFVFFSLLTNVVLSILELIGLHSVEERTILFIIGLISVILLGVYFVLFPLIKLLKPFTNKEFLSLAEFVGTKYPQIKDKLLNAIQLFQNTKEKSELTNAAILSELKKSEKLNFSETISFEKLKRPAQYLVISIVSATILFSLFSDLRSATYRILNYNIEFKTPEKFQFYIEPGNTTVTKGDNIKIKISIIGEHPSQVLLYSKNKENQVFTRQELFSDSNKIFNYQINSIRSSTEYYAKAEDVKSKHFKIKVINRPIISKLKIKVTPPKYSNLDKTILRENGNITALKGSKAELSISSNKILEDGELVFNDSIKTPLSIKGNKGNAKFTLLKNKKYFISITDTNGNKNIHPVEYSIKVEQDNLPSIEVIKPENDLALTKSEQINTELKINDDFGFNKLVLKHKLIQTNFGTLPEKYSSENISINKNLTTQQVYYVWGVSDMMLAAGDIVEFYFEVFDNDNISGPKSVKSKTFQLRVPTMEEIFKDAEAVQEEAQLDLEEVLKEAEKLKEEMKKLSNELKKDDKEITWDEKKKIEETAKRFEKLQKEIKEAQKKIDEAKKNLDNNDLLSKETLEKYNELQKLMDEMNSEEMKRAMEQMQKQMESMKRDEAQKSLSDMEFNEEAFKKSIERTVNLLKRIQIEQKMDEVIKRTEELKKEIDELKKETEKSNLSDKEKKKELAEKEKEISKKIDDLKKEMNKLQEKMSEFDEMPNKKMNEIQEEMKSQKNEELSKKTEEMLQQNMKMEAMQQMQQMSQNMEQMQGEMQQMQQQMQQQNQMQVLFEMMKGVDNLLTLSKEEEALKNKTEKSGNSSKLRMQNAQEQQKISDGLDKTIKQLSDLSQKTFAITPEMGKAIGKARGEMNKAMMAMQNGNSSLATMSQKGAMKYLNEAASMMKGNMEQMMNGGQGGGMMSMMQQMQQMSQQQMNINQLTKQMQQGKLTPQQQAQLQRLRQQQDMIRKSLEQLNKENKESGKSKTLTSNLEKILEEMKEVITNMNTDKIDDKLIQSQEKILSKLLDAQRSINERDFEKNRESTSSKTFVRNSPEELNLDSEKNREKIKDELMKIINEGYSKDYEELIRKYYEILEKEQKNEISK